MGILKLNKRYRKLFLVLVLYLVLSLAMFWILRRNFIWNGDDIYYQFQRIMGLGFNFTDGLLTSNISPTNFGKMGYGVNIFYPWLTMIPFQLLYHVRGNWISAYYLGLLFYFMTSFLISHYSMKKFSGSSKLAVLFAVIYNFSTYRLIEMFTRASLAEYLASVFLPLCFVGFYQLFFSEGHQWKNLTIGLSLVIFSHVLTTFMTVILFILILAIWYYRIKFSKTLVLNTFKAMISTVMATLVFTVPFLSEEAYQKYSVPDPTKLKGLDFSALFQASLNNTSYRAIEGNTYNIGFILIVALLIGLVLFKKFSRTFKATYLMYIFTLVLTTNLFPWTILQNTPVQVIQYPFRFLLFATLFGSVVMAQEVAIIFKASFEKRFVLMAIVLSIIAGGLWTASIQNAYPNSLLSKSQLIIDQRMINEDRIPDSYLAQYVPVREQKQIDSVEKHDVWVGNKKSVQIPRVDYKGNYFTFRHIRKNTKIDLPYVKYKYTNANIYGRPVTTNYSKRGSVEIIAPRNYNTMRIELSYGNRNLFILATSLSILAWIYLWFSEPIAQVLVRFKRKENNVEIVS